VNLTIRQYTVLSALRSGAWMSAVDVGVRTHQTPNGANATLGSLRRHGLVEPKYPVTRQVLYQITTQGQVVLQRHRPRESIVCSECGMSTRLVDIIDGVRTVTCANPLCDSNLPPVPESA
jgi:DNA-binding MarR family transcriptional regulator